MSDERQKIGKLGEDKAVEMLKRKKYKILERNEENKYGELDIIALDGEEMVFVEVRSKTGVDFGLPEETVKYKKKRRLIRNAKRYIKYQNINTSYRIDVIGIIFNKKKNVKRIKHYKNITL